MRAAQPDEQPSQETEMRRMDPNGDGIIDKKEACAIARSTAELRASKSKYQKGLIATIALLVLSWIGNAGLTVAVINFSKDLKVEGGSLKDAKDGGAISTESQKKVYEVTLLFKSESRQHEHRHEHEHEHEHSGGTNESSTVVAQVTCASVMEAISSIEKGNDGSLVKMDLGDGKFWEPRMSAAFYHLHDDSFSIEQIYLDDQRDVSYDVTCEIPMSACENHAPGSLCDVVSSEVGFDGAFDGDIPSRRSRRLKPCKNGSHRHYYYGTYKTHFDWHNCD